LRKRSKQDGGEGISPFFRFLHPPYLAMAAEKKAFVLRIQPETLKELERWAQDEFRSVNGQIEFLLNDALRKRKKRPPHPPDDDTPSPQQE
jgi:hypothetical protein